MSSVNQFLAKKCAGDVINSVTPLKNPLKSLSTSWEVIKTIQPLTITEKGKYEVVNFCAGNCVAAIMAAHILPVKRTWAIDSKITKKQGFENVDRFTTFEGMEIKDFIPRVQDNDIIIAIHPKPQECVDIIDLFNQTTAKVLCLVPGIPGLHMPKKINCLKKLPMPIDKYELWCLVLMNIVAPNHKLTMRYYVRGINSPYNTILYAERMKYYG
jgi:hypothetical protein